MRRHQFISLFLIAFAGLSTATSYPVTIQGELENSESYNRIYLYEMFGQFLIKLDSAIVKNGHFTLKTNVPGRGLFKVGVSEKKSFPLIIGENDLALRADLKNLENSLVVQNSAGNRAYRELQQFQRAIKSEKANLERIYREENKTASRETRRQQSRLLKSKFDSLNDVQNKFYKEFSAKNKDLFIGKVVGYLVYEDPADQANYFKDIDFSDPELLRGDFINQKVNIFFQRILPRNVNFWKSGANRMLEMAPQNSRHKELTYLAIIELLNTTAPRVVAAYGARFKDEFPQASYASRLIDTLPPEELRIGDEAPDFSMENIFGEEIRLSSLQGKVVLLDFWASWCKPCRKENPNIVKAYRKYHDKDFTVVSVSLDDDREKWLRAIKKDKLVWDNLADFTTLKNRAAIMYGVEFIPTSFLIDRQGKIRAKNPRGEKLHRLLDNLL